MTPTARPVACPAARPAAIRLGAALLVPGALLLLAPGAARAQVSPPSTSHVGPAVNAPASKDLGKVAPPPALPGAEPAAEGVIPADKGVADLPPTEALFDSIHRGDVASARDALNRGADLDGRNVLGQSPLDLSIDLNRNDITFLLLSMRGPGGGDRGEHGPGGAEAEGAPPAAVAPRGRHVREARGHAPRAGEMQGGEPAEPGAVDGPRPVLFANDGGAPRPSVGFLGFALR